MNTVHKISEYPLYALICAAGVGARAGGVVPKQYQNIHDAPMFWHTIQAFANVPEIARVYVVISPADDWFAHSIAPLLTQNSLNDRVVVLPVGGSTRAESVCNGLAELDGQLGANDEAWVMVHDAARPCVDAQTILRLRDEVWREAQTQLEQSAEWQAVGGILALPMTDTVKLSTDHTHIKKTVDRNALWGAQTPQMFTVSRLYNALSDALTDEEVAQTITDEASVMEWSGYQPLLVQGDARNIKVTYPQDFELAGFYLKKHMAQS
jgi:2-C-methyl-D-erythritol 4-phosphate cytidylyltransferase